MRGYIEGIFKKKNLLNDLIDYELLLLLIIGYDYKLQDIIQLNELDYESKCEETYNFSKYVLTIVFK